MLLGRLPRRRRRRARRTSQSSPCPSLSALSSLPPVPLVFLGGFVFRVADESLLFLSSLASHKDDIKGGDKGLVGSIVTGVSGILNVRLPSFLASAGPGLLSASCSLSSRYITAQRPQVWSLQRSVLHLQHRRPQRRHVLPQLRH
jgi:hypothetical protein